MDSIITQDIRFRKSSDGTNSNSDEVIDNQVDGIYQIMEPYKDKILGIGIGNHEDTIVRKYGTNPVKRLAEKLGTKYLGYSFLLRLLFSDNGGQGRTVVIRGHHGWGGGSRTQGADLTKYSKDMAYFEADIFLYGHVHKLLADAIPRLSLVGDNLISRPKHLCICGCFLKTYSDNTDATYSEEAGFPPVPIGGLEIGIRPSKKWAEVTVSVWRA